MNKSILKKINKYPIKELIPFRDGLKWDNTERIDFSHFGQQVDGEKLRPKKGQKFIILDEDEDGNLFWCPIHITSSNSKNIDRWYLDVWEEEIENFDFTQKYKKIPNLFRLNLK